MNLKSEFINNAAYGRTKSSQETFQELYSQRKFVSARYLVKRINAEPYESLEDKIIRKVDLENKIEKREWGK